MEDRRALPVDRCPFLARGHDLGYASNNLHAYLPCRICGTLRWVPLSNLKPRNRYCPHCVSPERRRKLSAVASGRTLSPEWKERIRVSCRQAAMNRRSVAVSSARGRG